MHKWSIPIWPGYVQVHIPPARNDDCDVEPEYEGQRDEVGERPAVQADHLK